MPTRICSKCGLEKDIEEFRLRTSIERLEEELRKCTVLCSNCHRRLTAKERGWFRSKQ